MLLCHIDKSLLINKDLHKPVLEEERIFTFSIVVTLVSAYQLVEAVFDDARLLDWASHGAAARPLSVLFFRIYARYAARAHTVVSLLLLSYYVTFLVFFFSYTAVRIIVK